MEEPIWLNDNFAYIVWTEKQLIYSLMQSEKNCKDVAEAVDV